MHLLPLIERRYEKAAAQHAPTQSVAAETMQHDSTGLVAPRQRRPSQKRASPKLGRSVHAEPAPAAPELPNPFAAFFDKPKAPEPEPEPEPEASNPFEAFGKMFGGDK